MKVRIQYLQNGNPPKKYTYQDLMTVPDDISPSSLRSHIIEELDNLISGNSKGFNEIRIRVSNSHDDWNPME